MIVVYVKNETHIQAMIQMTITQIIENKDKYILRIPGNTNK